MIVFFFLVPVPLHWRHLAPAIQRVRLSGFSLRQDPDEHGERPVN